MAHEARQVINQDKNAKGEEKSDEERWYHLRQPSIHSKLQGHQAGNDG